MGTKAGLAKDAGTLGFELGLRGLDIRDLEADVVLAAQWVFLEELHDRRAFAERFDQLDLAVGRVDEADTNSLRGQIEGETMRLGAEHGAVKFEAFLDRCRRDADMVQAAEFHFLTP